MIQNGLLMILCGGFTPVSAYMHACCEYTATASTSAVESLKTSHMYQTKRMLFPLFHDSFQSQFPGYRTYNDVGNRCHRDTGFSPVSRGPHP